MLGGGHREGGEGGGSALLPPHRTPPSSPHHNAPPVRTAHLGRVEVGGVIFIGAFAFALRGDEGGGRVRGGAVRPWGPGVLHRGPGVGPCRPR